MNNRMLALLSFLCITSLYADRSVTPTIAARSQGRDATRKLVGVSDKVHQYDAGQYYFFSATPEYMRTFRADRIAECLFGDDLFCGDCGNSIKIQGSDVASRDPKAWLADYFYLPPDYDAQFSVKPVIQNILVDFDFYVGLDEWKDGLYFRLYGPFTWTRWNLNFCEPCDVVTSGSLRAGYFSWNAMDKTTHTVSSPLDTFGQFAQGQAPIATVGSTTDLPTDQTELGVSFRGLKYAKMERCSRDRTGFADLRAELGWNFTQKEKYDLGIALQIAAPTGNKRNAEFAFDPTVGNGNHWEVGGVLRGHYTFWRSKTNEDRYLGVYLDANVTHLITAREQRTFDLKGRPNSRYMLAEQLGRPVNLLSAGTTTAATTFSTPIAQFTGIFAPVANLTTVNVNVSATIQADIVAMINYTCNAWEWDLGYNFWARSCERISLPARPSNDCCTNLCTGDKDVWALKGDAQVFGFMSASDSIGQDDPVALSATQCGATIHKGTNANAVVADCTGIDRLQNCGIDNAQFAYGDTNHIRLVHTTGLTAASDQIKTSVEPRFINCCDINFQRTRGMSHKIFTHLSYTWDSSSWTPFFGAGASIEFGMHDDDDCCASTPLDCTSSCSTSSCCNVCSGDCLDCALSQWAVWLKGGINFN